jgi:signal transduction histidine kinase
MEAMPDGGKLDVSLKYDEEENAAVICVSDTGVGMDDEAVERIFDPFYSTKDDGTGLGLAVSYGIIEGHGGDICVESELEYGSRFTIRLPYAPS